MHTTKRRWTYSTPITGALDQSNFTKRDHAVQTLVQGQTLVRNSRSAM